MSVRALAAASLAAVTALSAAAPAVAQRTAEQWRAEAARLQRQLDSDEQRRLRLDIKRLENETRFEGRVRPYLPLLGVAVGVIGGIVGFRRWQVEQRLAREVRAEEGIGRNLERLVDRPRDGTSRSARALSSIRSLDALTPDPKGWRRDKQRRQIEAQRGRVTDTLQTILLEDLAVIDDRSEARLPVLCLEWPPFAERVRTTGTVGKAVLANYERALNQLADGQKLYYASVERTADGGYRSPQPAPPDDEQRLFELLVAGYVRYVAAVPESARQPAVKAFEDALGNPALTRQLFGAD